MKHLKLTFLLTALLSAVGANVFAHDIEVANADGVTIYYVWTNDKTELAVSYRGSNYSNYYDRYSGTVTIPESATYNGKSYPVTGIGGGAFFGCSGLISVTIPNSVTSIGSSAFQGCRGLTPVTIPNSVTSIANFAFYDCIGLTSVTIPNSVTSIGDWAFSGCSGLTSVTIGNGVTRIGARAFSGCSGLTSVTIPNSVTSIGISAFIDCSGLVSVTIGNGVTSIEQDAFRGCSGLTSVTIPNSVTSIGSSAFYDTYLKSVTIGTGVLSIGYGAFPYSNSSSGKIPIKVIWLTNTPPSGYSNVSAYAHYVANDLYTSLSNKTVYPFLSSVFEVDGVKYVPVSPSERTCDAIDCLYDESAAQIRIGETVNFKGIAMTVKQVHPYALYENKHIKNVELNFQGNVGSYAFYGCTGVQKITANNVGNVGNYAFYNCTALQSANVSNDGSVGNYAFASCTALQTATLGEKSSLGQYSFSGCAKLQSIFIPNAEVVGDYAFQNCSTMVSAKMGSGVKTVGQYAFTGCTALSDLQIGSNVNAINIYAFSNCSALPKIVIPSKVATISNYVFNGCTQLKEVIMDDSPTELSLGSNGSDPLFSSCPLDSVYIGRNISYSTSSSYGYSPFYRNTSLRSVTITDKETEISPNEFYGCTNLKNVSIGDGVETIGNWAFSGCSSLDYFSFGSSVKTIGQEAFSDCTAMTRLISHATTPPTCGSQALDDINKWTCTLNVPSGCVSAYQSAAQWKEFFFVSEGEDESSVNPNPKKCAKPTIGYSNGKLSFHCDTEGVTFRSNITDSDITSYNSNEVQLTVTYHISAYATKSGYEDSETATATLCWIDVEPRTEGIDGTTSTKEIKANPVLIQSENGRIFVSGANDGTAISVYSTDGLLVGSAVIRSSQAIVNTSLRSGSIAIVKIGEKTVKVRL